MMEYDKVYQFKDCGQVSEGRYQQTVGKDSEGEIYHLFVIGDERDFCPVLVTHSRVLYTEEQQLFELLSNPRQHNFYDKVLAWHNRNKNK